MSPPTSTLPAARRLVIGLGNEYRGDDAVGRILARRLATQLQDRAQVREAGGESASLLEMWRESDLVVLIDSIRSGATPGTIHRFEAHRDPLPAEFGQWSSHGLGVAEAIELARVLGQLPRRLVVYGIEGAAFAPGTGLSPAVESAMTQLGERVSGELESGRTAEPIQHSYD